LILISEQFQKSVLQSHYSKPEITDATFFEISSEVQTFAEKIFKKFDSSF
jgi:hypothetical protein